VTIQVLLPFGSHTLEETEITEGQHFAFPILVSQSPAPPFQPPPQPFTIL
jgi:hypothetical protein